MASRARGSHSAALRASKARPISRTPRSSSTSSSALKRRGRAPPRGPRAKKTPPPPPRPPEKARRTPAGASPTPPPTAPGSAPPTAPRPPGLLLAPIDETGAGEDPTYQYVRELDKEADDIEAGRLFYVAATRARQRLHLLACAKADEDLRPKEPSKRSLLAKIWWQAREHFG